MEVGGIKVNVVMPHPCESKEEVIIHCLDEDDRVYIYYNEVAEFYFYRN